jgi:hypothetical protein
MPPPEARKMGPQACNLLFGVLVLFLVIVTWLYRGADMDLQKLNNEVVGTSLHVVQHRDPLGIKVDRGHIPDLVEIGVDYNTFDKNEARYFIEDHILPYFDDPQHKDDSVYF